MTRSLRSLLIVLWLLAIPLPVGAQTGQPSTRAQLFGIGPNTVNAVAWYDGGIQYSTITNCFSIIQGNPYLESGAGAFVGFAADPDAAQPFPGQTYYIHVYIAGLGNSCSGQYFYLDVQLPSNTTPAVTLANPVQCFLKGAPFTLASDCPQSLSASSLNPGALVLWANNPAHANLWPLPQGWTYEFRIPVVSSTALTNTTLQANIQVLDGNASPWLRPQQGVYVFSSNPTILYVSPATTAITNNNGHSEAYLYTHGLGGTGYFDLGTDTNYGLIHDPVTITAGGNAFRAWEDWGNPPPPVSLLNPNTLYHWRFIFTPSVGSTVYGADQTFRTLADGVVSIGQGATAGCTEAALNTALADPVTHVINLDCGLAPAKITVTSSHDVTGNLTINGGGTVTLEFPPKAMGNFYNVQSGGHLTLNQITLSKGSNAGCGGAIYVAAGGMLTVNKAKFDSNQSLQAGAICNWGTSDITATVFTNNAASSDFGGAIGNYGTMTVNGSSFSGNSAPINGGAIDMGGLVTITNSSFDTNHAGYRGGAINTYGGTLHVTTSSFSANTSGVYGGAIASDSSVTTLASSTLSSNTAAGLGGGIEMSSAGSLTITNSTISGNHATNQQGGGLFWNPGASTGLLTILNSTIASNTSGGQGGNIYAGGAANPSIQMKNTILSAGSPNNCDAPVGSQGHNLESAATCGLNAAGDLLNKDPKLGPLQNNGGTTATQALLPGSPAVDAGTNTGCPAADQRGVARPVDGNIDGSAVCDIGAFEAPPPIWKIFLPQLRR